MEPSAPLAPPGRWQRRVAEFKRGQGKGVMGRDPSGKYRTEHTDQRDGSGHHRHGRCAEAVANIAVKPAGKGWFHCGKPVNKHQRRARVAAMRWCGLSKNRSWSLFSAID